MFQAKALSSLDKAAFYQDLEQDLAALLSGEPDWIATLANMSAYLMQMLPDLNWAGFYLMQQGALVLGPFQGKPACTRIAVGRGVCGNAVAERRSQCVYDVHAFPGHIACDAASASELVVPLIDAHGAVIGVLDLDSPNIGRFDAQDQAGCEALVACLMRHHEMATRVGLSE
jgi:L-methionine (R)-S-oxide reductase